ncbi:EamA/RhaT family transporter [Helicobacter cholecystus]|uniref:EamA/RhaT family transporter n=1 Tax=Helicobacter cholecystus TaxID=45498 RepID=A0A3D8IXQ5_9HELI|nr:DMT family transporter [Helicobacter cholecystus]RDU70059.1 EamA/RhaT family transporter [Helicobacter cholecystus]VEJ24770.1 Probable amino-acid metabolite efflux pump [Helicobacter cholecystus]
MKRFIFLAILAEAFIIYASVLVKVVNLSPIIAGFYRILFALPIFMLFANRRLLQAKAKDMLLMLGAGVFFGLDLVFFNLALHKTSIANVNLFASLVCFILVPIGAIFFKEKIHLDFILGSLISLVGVFILIKGRGGESVATPLGDFLAFLSMVCYGIFLSLVYGLRKRYDTLTLMSFASLGSIIVLLSIGIPMEGFSTPQDWHTLGMLIAISLFGQVLGQGCFGYIMGKLDAQVSSLILLFTPMIAGLMGYFLLGEKLGVYEILGMVIIVLGIYIAKIREKKKKK